MSVVVKRLPGESIIIATIEGEMTREKAVEVFEQSSPILEEIEGPVYRITDVSRTTSSFTEMISVLSESGKGKTGSSSDPRIQVILVGTSTWVRFFQNAMAAAHQGGKHIAVFDNMEDALVAARFALESLKAAGE